MKSLIFILLICVYCESLIASSFTVYEGPLVGYEERKDNFAISLSSLPRVEHQSNLGFCYAFSSRTLLEQYHCKINRTDCSKLSNDEKFSVLDIASYEKNSPYFLKEGGEIVNIFKHIKRFRRRHYFATEECASYDKLNYNFVSHKIDGKKSRASVRYRSALGGWKYLQEQYSLYEGASFNRKSDIVLETKSNLNLNVKIDDLTKSFATLNDLESLYFNALVPRHCRKDSTAREIYDFEAKTFPKKNSEKTKTIDYLAKIYTLLKNDIPFNASFCAEKRMNEKTNKEECYYHGAVIKGINKVCLNQNYCELMVQFHNSYGMSWQNRFDGGWVRLMPILENLWSKEKLNWLEAPGENLVGLTSQEYSWLHSTVVVKFGGKTQNKTKVTSQKRTKNTYRCGRKYTDIKINDQCVPMKIY